MNLFNQNTQERNNLLPGDGTLLYFGSVLPMLQANALLELLLHSTEWKQDEIMMFGKKIITKRKVGWYGDEPFQYTYSKITRTALTWTPAMLQLKELATKITGHTYNSCLLNLYHDGSEGMGWHSDAEKQLLRDGAIASFSFGAVRKFMFKHKTSGTTVQLQLEHGSLLLMKGSIQTHWLHRLPATKMITRPRVNLTFRTIEVPVALNNI